MYRFVDHAMAMRYFGGGVGHASMREATNIFLMDCCQEELEEAENTAENDGGELNTAPTFSNKDPVMAENYDFDSDRLSNNSEERVDEDKDDEMDGEECEDDGKHDDL
ncbi:hypothetical protein APHAL10511_008686 [Amanita phalloides]|nr:hypothetical protein APHAL10511_008686 [Amanita phalloides]